MTNRRRLGTGPYAGVLLTVLGAGVTLTTTPAPGSAAGLHLVASGVCSIVLTN